MSAAFAAAAARRLGYECGLLDLPPPAPPGAPAAWRQAARTGWQEGQAARAAPPPIADPTTEGGW